MADDVVDYSGTSDSDSESDKVPRTGLRRHGAVTGSQLPASEILHFAHGLSVLHWHAECGYALVIAGKEFDRRL
jgi:hypothetical protein